jgi:hypothetical protein
VLTPDEVNTLLDSLQERTYGSSSLRARAEANSHVVHMLVPMEKPFDSAKSKGFELPESLLWVL